MKSADNIWEQVKSHIKTHIPQHKYNMWIKPLAIIRQEGNTIWLFAPNAVFVQRLKEHFLPMLTQEFTQITKQDVTIEFDTRPRQKESSKMGDKESAQSQNPGQKKITSTARPLPKTNHPRLPGFESPFYQSRLMKKGYTFDNFVVGDNSNFAYCASLSLAKDQLSGTKIVYLMGRCGLGKSHLSQATGHHIISKNPRSRVYYVTAEDFTNEMIYALHHKTIEAFKEKYRRYCDTLILEDVHFLSGKMATQKELVLTLDYLLDADKKIVFSGYDCPKEIPKLDPQLTSRLSMGLLTELKAPDFATRVKILEKKSSTLDCQIPKTVLEFLAQELNSDVRQLESGLFGVSAKAALLNRAVDMKLAESVVCQMVQQRRKITLESIKELVCKEFSVTEKQLLSKSRKQDIVRPRQIAMFLARKYTDLPLKQIGAGFNKYHATALYAMNTVEKQLEQKGQVYQQISYLSKKLERPNTTD